MKAFRIIASKSNSFSTFSIRVDKNKIESDVYGQFPDYKSLNSFLAATGYKIISIYDDKGNNVTNYIEKEIAECL